jgi:hypothetical protein
VITDRFGFLACDWTFNFDGGEISPIREINKVRKRVEKLTNSDGFLYAPHCYRVTLNPRTQKRSRKVPGSDRSALLHPVPPSHQLRLSEPMNQEELRRGAGGFLFTYSLTFLELGFNFMIGGLVVVYPLKYSKRTILIYDRLRWKIFCHTPTRCGVIGDRGKKC